MMTSKRRFLILLSCFFFAACKEGKKNEVASTVPIQTTNLNVLEYDAISAKILLQGTLAIPDVADLDIMEVYTNSSCQGARAGTALVRDFESVGIQFLVPSTEAVSLYVSTANSTACLLFTKFDPADLQPSSPSFNKVSPISPSKVTFQPGIFGEAWPSSARVKFFKDQVCSLSVGEGDADDFSSIGIQVHLTPNSVTPVFALTEDPLGKLSECISLTEFRHANLILPNPTFSAAIPASPNNQTNQPLIQGVAESYTELVELFSDSACSLSLSTGTLAEFASGIQVALTSNVTNGVYARITDDLGNKSPCAFLTSYEHDTVGPSDPTYVSASPVSPTNQTTSPLLTGTAPPDSLITRFFDSSLCLTQIGTGLSSSFTGTGLAANLPNNQTTAIYAKNFDAAGNGSSCVYMTDYKHNTIPPNAPTFGGTTPLSPTNGTTEPLFYGTPSQFTVSLSFFTDELCVTLSGSGSHTDFQSPGLTVTLAANTNSTVYTRVYDVEGNESSCYFLGGYDHSNLPAPAPGFLFSFPTSPNKTSTTPFIIGTADNSIASVEIFDDNTCGSSLGSGTRPQFVSSGVQISVPANSTTNLHAIATDVFGNVSGCTLLTQYIHNTVPPLDPTFTMVSPATPNNISYAPTLSGTALADPGSQLSPNEVEFYDSGICVNKLGEGTPAQFTTGIGINSYRNAVTSIYARSFDAAGNASSCTLMVNYTHDDLQPGHPVFLNVAPTSPSFVPQTVLSGYYSSSLDFLNKVSVGIYSDSGCSVPLATGAPNDLTTTGLTVTLPENQVTQLYGETVNEVGTRSNCNLLTSFRHYDTPPSSVAANANFDGSVALSWLPDPVSTPVLNYTVERATSTLGPFTVLSTGLVSNTYQDKFISEGQDYFYRVFTSNTTGRSQYSQIAGITIASPAPQQANSLVAYPGPGEVYLTWSGFSQNMSYKVFRATQKGGPFLDLGVNPNTTSYTDSSTTNDQAYYYYVVGTNPAGDSSQSNLAQVMPKGTPPAPSNLSITPVFNSPNCGGASAVYLAWAPSPYFDTFEVRGWGGGALGTTSQNSYVVCSGNITGAESFRVRAVWGDGFSSYSNNIWFDDTGGVPLTVNPGDGEVLLQWTENATTTSWYTNWGANYDIYRATSLDGPYTLIQTGHTGTSYTDTAVVNGTGYFYYIQAFVVDFLSEKRYVGYPSLTQSGVPQAMPSAPSNLILTRDESLGIKLDWQGSGYQNFYRLYSASSPGGPFFPSTLTTNSFLYGAPASEGMNYYRVVGVWGTAETAPSNVVSVRKAGINNLTAVSTSTEVQLDWLDVPGVANYEIFRATMVSGPFTSIGSSGTSNFNDASVAIGEGHYYRVRAQFADATNGELSSIVKGARAGSTFASGVSADSITSNSFRANWTAVSGATKYEVHVSTLVGGPFSKMAEHPSQTSMGINGLLGNTQYFFFVRSLVGGTNYDSTPVATVTTIGKPSAPIGTVRNNEVNLSWTPLIGATDYNLTRSVDGVTFTTVVANHPTSSYLDTGVTNGSMYFYKLIVNYPLGSISSDPTTGLIPGISPYAPSSLTVNSDGTGTGALLSWGRVDGVSSYSIYRATAPGGPFTTPVQTTASFENVLDAGLTPGSAYYYQVRSRNGDMLSGPSSVVGFVPGLNQTAPAVAYANAGAVTISWGAVTGATQYDLYRAKTTAAKDFQVVTTGLTGLGYEDSSIDPTKTYFYYYLPKNAGGIDMAPSDVSAGVNVSIAPLAPTGLNAEVVGLASVNLEWITTPTAENYEVFRSTTSGGPYSLIGSVVAPSVTYSDNTVVGGNSYFYVIQAINSSDVHSVNSSEVGVRVETGPTGVAAANTPGGVNVTWNVVGGASQYQVRRSDWSGGPYGLIGTTAGTSLVDTSTSPQQNYYYVVQAVFASGEASQQSSEASLLRSGVVDLVVPVEMIDQPVGSTNVESRVFERSRTFIDTNYYDGTVTYKWEVIATNTEGVAREIRLRDGGNALISSITVPAGTTVPVRLTQALSLNAGGDSYRLELEQTTSTTQLNVFNSRLLIEQVGATKTRLYYPLLTSDGLSMSGDSSVAVLQTTLSSFQSQANALSFRRQAQKLSKLIDYNAWELEALVSSSGGATGSIQLFNRTSDTPVPMTETNFSSSSIQRARIFIDEGASQFGTVNENDLYEVQVRCDLDCDLGDVKVHKAGVWVQLENLTKAVVILRNSPSSASYAAGQTLSEQRAFLDLSQYTNEQVFFQADVYEDGSSGGTVELQSHAQDSGTVGLAIVAGSSLSFNLDQRQVLRSGALTVNSTDRFVARVVPSSGVLQVYGTFMVIHVNAP